MSARALHFYTIALDLGLGPELGVTAGSVMKGRHEYARGSLPVAPVGARRGKPHLPSRRGGQEAGKFAEFR